MIFTSTMTGKVLCECYDCGDSIECPADPEKQAAFLAANDWYTVEEDGEEEQHFCPLCLEV